jgi:uncharacterized membrane protein
MDDDISTDLHQGQKMICYYTTSVVVFNSFWINVKKIFTKKEEN